MGRVRHTDDYIATELAITCATLTLTLGLLDIYADLYVYFKSTEADTFIWTTTMHHAVR